MTFDEWLAGAPAIAAELAEEWAIDVGAPFVHDGATSWVAPVGDGAVLKITWPHEEATYEADALRLWDGDGAVRLLRHDRARWALLIERCVPGAQLGFEWDDDTVVMGASMLQRLWREVDDDAPFDTVAAMCGRWATITAERAETADHGLDPGVVREAIGYLAGLANDERVLLHQDLHPGNVLSSTREPWLVIDPKPIVGDRGFDCVRLVAQGVRDVAHQRERLGVVEDLVGIDREHLRRWALARNVESAMLNPAYRPAVPLLAAAG